MSDAVDAGAAIQQALRLARVGLWEWDVKSDRVVWTDTLYDIFGVDRSRFTTSYQGYLARVHPDDRERVDRVIQEAFRSGGAYDVRHRVVRDDGAVRHIHSTGEAIQQDGATVQMRGAAADVTEAAELDRLRELNEFKARFISVAAHELRTPITPLRLQLAILRDRHAANLDPQGRKAIEVMGRNVERLATLVEDILASARLQANRLALHRRPCDLTALVGHVVESFDAAAQQVKVRLEHRVDPDLRAEVDPGRIEQVVTNLVTNALKFTPEGGSLRIEAHRADEKVTITVADSGLGMDPEQLARLFQPFTQVHDAPELRMRGTGLGLYIAKGIVDEHGGTISASSAGPGKGSTFTVMLPATRKPVEAEAPKPKSTARRYRELI